MPPWLELGVLGGCALTSGLCSSSPLGCARVTLPLEVFPRTPTPQLLCTWGLEFRRFPSGELPVRGFMVIDAQVENGTVGEGA